MSRSIPLIPPYPAAVPGAYSLEIQIFRGFWMVSWFKEQFGLPEQALAAETRRRRPRTLFDELVDEVPPGSMGLMLQPYWSPGMRSPGPEAKGAIIGFGDVHTRAHLYRAILEGLAYALREGKERIEQRSHVPITRAAGLRRRLAERRGHAADRRHLWPADRAPARLRDLGAGRGHRRGGGPGSAAGL